MEIAEELVQKINIHPQHNPIRRATQQATTDTELNINQIELEDLEDSTTQPGDDDAESQPGGGDVGTSPSF